jgi:predicted histone-like DNA-binding protein
MTVKYNVVEHINPADPQAPGKYYPSLKASGRTTLRHLAERIAKMSTISSADTMAMLEALLIVIPQELADGNVVELGDLGSFWLNAIAVGANSPEKVSTAQITTLLPRFNPGKEFKRTLAKIEFEKG